MDAQEEHDLQLRNVKISKDSRKRVEALLRRIERSSLLDSQHSMQDPLVAMQERTGATSEELLKEIEAAGF